MGRSFRLLAIVGQITQSILATGERLPVAVIVEPVAFRTCWQSYAGGSAYCHRSGGCSGVFDQLTAAVVLVVFARFAECDQGELSWVNRWYAAINQVIVSGTIE